MKFLETLETFRHFGGLTIEGGEKMTDFEAVYARHFDSVYRYVYSLCRHFPSNVSMWVMAL